MSERNTDGAMVDIIVPVYNQEKYLPRCIESILRQSYTKLHLWLVDDGSSDTSPDIMARFAQEDPRVSALHQENAGPTAASMTGVRASHAPYLMFVDCDDWIDEDCVENLMRYTGTDPDGEVICSSYVIEREWNGTQQRVSNEAAPGEYTGEKLRTQIFEQLLGNERRTLILSRCMKLFARKLVEDNLGFCNTHVRMGEDVCMTTPVFFDARRIVVCPEGWYYHYRFVRASMAHAYDRQMIENMHLVRDTLCRIYEAKHMDTTQVDREYFYLFLLVLKNEIRSRPEAGEGGVRRTVARIQELCRIERAAELSKCLKASPTDPANRLLMQIVRHPDALHILAVRAIFLLKG